MSANPSYKTQRTPTTDFMLAQPAGAVKCCHQGACARVPQDWCWARVASKRLLRAVRGGSRAGGHACVEWS